MPAFLAAVDALQPHANLEFDVQLSADGVPVESIATSGRIPLAAAMALMHSSNVER